MPIRSMTGFAQVRGEVQRQTGGASSSNGHLSFSLSLKSVNHRFLDLHFRTPSGTDSLEMQLRKLLKEKMARGHVEVTLALDRSSGDAFTLNREIVGGYITAFRTAAAEFSFLRSLTSMRSCGFRVRWILRATTWMENSMLP